MNRNLRQSPRAKRFTKPSPKVITPRATAATLLARLFTEKHSLDRLLSGPEMSMYSDPQERALIQELCYGVCRWYYRLDFLLGRLLEKPVRAKDMDIKALLLCGLYQLDYLRMPAHAAVSETVGASIPLNKDWAKSLINGVLRHYLRRSEELQALTLESPSARYAHPEWLIKALQQDWPGHWETILQANNQRPPMHLRVNRLHIERDQYMQRLGSAGLTATASAMAESGICMDDPVGVEKLPGFQDGDVSVQDFGAQLASPILDLQPGQRVLDACAAPGGKTAHIFATQPRLEALVAVEHDNRRVKLLHDTKQRLGINALIVHADAGLPETWWDGEQFDRILLDAPCSATGVIRRHPDIKLLRETEMMTQYTTTQCKLLRSVWPLLKQGGKLVYSTCSLLNIENDLQIAKFTDGHPDARAARINGDWGTATEFGRRTLPGHDESDGFYYALLEKV